MSARDPQPMTFVIRTVEQVEGIYHVQAASAEEAREQFEADPRHRGEQISYSAFEIQVRDVTLAETFEDVAARVIRGTSQP